MASFTSATKFRTVFVIVMFGTWRLLNAFPHAETDRLNFVSQESGISSLDTVADLYEVNSLSDMWLLLVV